MTTCRCSSCCVVIVGLLAARPAGPAPPDRRPRGRPAARDRRRHRGDDDLRPVRHGASPARRRHRAAGDRARRRGHAGRSRRCATPRHCPDAVRAAPPDDAAARTRRALSRSIRAAGPRCRSYCVPPAVPVGGRPLEARPNRCPSKAPPGAPLPAEEIFPVAPPPERCASGAYFLALLACSSSCTRIVFLPGARHTPKLGHRPRRRRAGDLPGARPRTGTPPSARLR